MGHFESLSPEKARMIEEEAIEKYKTKIPRKDRKTYTEPGTLHRVKSIFPLQLFPDELIVTKEKVTHLRNMGPGMREVIDIPLNDVVQVEADVGPIFGHVHVHPKMRKQEDILITRVWKKDALAIQRIIESLIKRPPEEKAKGDVYY